MSTVTSLGEAPWPGYALPHGTTVNGYRIERVLGSGGFGVTYLARDLLLQPFAVKEYFPRQLAIRQDLNVVAASAEDAPLFEECRERFLREAQALVLLGRVSEAGDGIVRVQTYFEACGTCFLVMDYIEGTSLASVLREERDGLSAARVRSLLSQLLSSIRVVHQAGLMHRDIKPANIILRDNDRAVLIDFGSSRAVLSGHTSDYTQIYSGSYAPPEQMLGLRQAEFSDIYAIGAVCYRAIGGTVVDALARQNALAAGRLDPQPAAEQIGAGRYPRPLLAVIDSALAIDPAQRPQSVDSMLASLGRDEPVAEPTVVLPRRTVPTARPRRLSGPRVVAPVAGAVAGAVALVGLAYFLLRSPTPPPAGQEQVAVSAPPATLMPVAPVPSPATPMPVAPAPSPPAPATVPEIRQPNTGSPGATDAPPQAPTAIAQPDAAPTVEPAPTPPVDQSRQEAIVMPPTPPPVPVPSPEASPLDLARAAAQSLPCSVLNVASGQDGMRISGLAPAGQGLDRLLGDLRDAGRLADDISRIERFACAPVATVAALVRRTWDGVPPALAVRLDQRIVASGARLGINVVTVLPALYVDLYQSDGSVRHLLRPAPSGTANRALADWVATPPPGTRLVVALGSATPLDLGTRPETERASDYLAALQLRLQRAAVPPAADLSIVTVIAAEPAMAKAPPRRPTSLKSDRCANIVSRAQLGETLSDGELAALRTECRS
jgi:serine/threonine protein kinase